MVKIEIEFTDPEEFPCSFSTEVELMIDGRLYIGTLFSKKE